jgi:hypothetical protein
MKQLSERWKAMGPAERAPYMAKQEEDKRRQDREKREVMEACGVGQKEGKARRRPNRLPSGITSWMIFTKIKRIELNQLTNSRIKNEEVTSICGKLWLSMDDKLKERFKNLATQYN